MKILEKIINATPTKDGYTLAAQIKVSLQIGETTRIYDASFSAASMTPETDDIYKVFAFALFTENRDLTFGEFERDATAIAQLLFDPDDKRSMAISYLNGVRATRYVVSMAITFFDIPSPAIDFMGIGA